MRAILAWEAGEGRNHVVTLRTVADDVSDRFSFDAALCKLHFRNEVDPICNTVYSGPALTFEKSGPSNEGGPSDWDSQLSRIGFHSADDLERSLGWWQALYRECKADLVIADMAPRALMAARGMGIKTAGVGIGFGLPPSDSLKFPHFGDETERTRLVNLINPVIGKFGVPPLGRLAEIYSATRQIVFCLPMFDPFLEERREELLPPIGTTVPTRLAGAGDEIFVYFATTRGRSEQWVEALAATGLPIRAYMPALNPSAAQQLAAKGIIIDNRPSHIDDIARRTRLFVHAGSLGSFCIGVAAGLPHVIIPLHQEHAFNARRATAKGIAVALDKDQVNPQAFCEAVASAYHDQEMAGRARALAIEVRPFCQQNRRKQVRRRLDLF